MGYNIRGSEVVLSVTVSDEFAATFGIYGRLNGSFFKVENFTSTTRQDLVEEPFLGEKFDDLDQQHHGWDLAFSIKDRDQSVLNFMDLVIYKEENDLPPPDVTIQVTYYYRDPAVQTRSELYTGGFMKLSERSAGSRKDYVMNSMEAKMKYRKVLVG